MTRRVATALTLLFLFASGAVVRAGWSWPPVRLVARYGLPPAGGPTGRVRTVADIPFVEIEPGYVRVVRHVFRCRGNPAGRFSRPLGLDAGVACEPSPEHYLDEWVEIPERRWLTWSVVDAREWLLAHGAAPPERDEVVELCRQLEERVGGSFRVAARTEVYLAAATDAIDAHGREVEEPTAPGPDLLGRRRPPARLLLAGAGFEGAVLDEREVLRLPRRRGVRLVWIPPEEPPER